MRCKSVVLVRGERRARGADWDGGGGQRAAVERVAADADDVDTAETDTTGFAQEHGAAPGRGHASGNPHYLVPVVPVPLSLPFPTGITDGTSNTILFGER